MKEAFIKYFGKKPNKYVTASGRINVIGEHVDYCGGKVLPASLSLKCHVYAKENGSDKINIALKGFDDIFTLDLDKLAEYKEKRYVNYQAGVAYYLKQGGVNLVGCDLYYDCQVPFGSGLSSSAAIEVATAVTLLELAKSDYNLIDVALLAQRAENEYVGMNCGIMDQFASAMGKENQAILLNCATLQYQYIPLSLGEYSLIIANSNKPHNLIESKYNERRQETFRALEIIKEKRAIDNLSDLTVGDLEEIKSYLPQKLFNRVEHVVKECYRVEKAVTLLSSGDLKGLGEILNQGHYSLKDLYEVTGFELDTLSNLAREKEYCLGSRMIGGGFGGCTISIVKSGFEGQFIKEVGEEYLNQTGYRADFYKSEIKDGVTVENI